MTDRELVALMAAQIMSGLARSIYSRAECVEVSISDARAILAEVDRTEPECDVCNRQMQCPQCGRKPA